MKARDLMTSDVWACSQDASLSEAAQLMWDHDCGCLPVTDGAGRIVGMISDRDICMATHTRGQPPAQVNVGSAMSRDPITCSPDDSVRTIEGIMRDRQVRRIPVVEGSRVVGMVGIGDLIRHARVGGVRSALIMPALLKTLDGIYERRQAAAAAE